jgi:hypothetical protein
VVVSQQTHFFSGNGNAKGCRLAVKKIIFINDSMLQIILRGCWCGIIVLDVDAPTSDKSDDTKESFYKELDCVFDQFLKYHMTILLGEFSEKVGTEDIFKLTIGNECLLEICKVMEVRIVNFATSKNLMYNVCTLQYSLIQLDFS